MNDIDYKAIDGDRVKGYEGGASATSKIESHTITTTSDSSNRNSNVVVNNSSSSLHAANANDNPDSKPALRMPLKPLSSIKALPSINGGLLSPLGKIGSSSTLTPLGALGEKKKQTEEVLKRSQEQLSEHRKKEDQIREKIMSSVDPEEVERRALHMRTQRELLLAKKKAERDEKVQIEEERQAKKYAMDDGVLAESVQRLIEQKSLSNNKNDNKSTDVEDMNELRRGTLRNALARRMKIDLLDSEDAKISQMQDNQFAELDKRLQQVEQQREDNRKREYILNKQMERQQAQIARNIRISAKELKDKENEI